MSFNYLTNSSGFTRIAAYVGELIDGAVDGHIEKLSQQLRPDPPQTHVRIAADRSDARVASPV